VSLVIFRIPLSCLPSLAAGLVPVGRHYYEGSDFCRDSLRLTSPVTSGSLPYGGRVTLPLSGQDPY